jgi:death on curing protein
VTARYPTIDDIVRYHRRVCLGLGQAVPPVIAFEKLEAAVARPATDYFGEEQFPTLTEKAAALLQAIVIGHPFLDGNKRAGLGAAMLLLEMNGAFPEASDDRALYDLVIAVASGEIREVPEIAARLRELFGLPE